jgi:hypothetical protein
MDAMAVGDVLVDVEHTQKRARGDRRATSVPLIVFGALTLVDALIRSLSDPTANALALLLAPIGFAAIALYYRRREIVVGVGSKPRPYAVAALVVVLGAVLLVSVLLVFGVYAVVGLGLLAIAVGQRNLALGVCAIVYGVVGALEGLSLISNRLYAAADWFGLFRGSDGYFSWSPSLVYGVLGALLIGAGLLARKHEMAPT